MTRTATKYLILFLLFLPVLLPVKVCSQSVTLNDTATVYPGQQDIVIPVQIEQFAGTDIIAFEFTLGFDSTVIRNVGIEPVYGWQIIGSRNQQILRISGIGMTPLPDSTVLFNLRFDIKPDAPTGQMLFEIQYAAFFAQNFGTTQTLLPVEKIPGGVTVEPLIAGDVDYDGTVTTTDARIVLRYTIGTVSGEFSMPWSSKRYTAADMDGNRSLEAWDAWKILSISQ